MVKYFFRLSFKTQLILFVSLGIIITGTSAFLYVINTQVSAFQNFYFDSINTSTKTVKLGIELGLSKENFQAINQVFEWLKHDTKFVNIILKDENNETIASFPQTFEKTSDELNQLIKANSIDNPTYYVSQKWDAVYLKGNFYIGFSTNQFLEQKKQALIRIIAFEIILLLIGFIITFYMSSKITLPLRRLQKFTEKIDGGDMSARADHEKGNKETNLVAKSINAMVDKLLQIQKERIEEVTAFNNALELQNLHLEDQVAKRTNELVVAIEEVKKADKLKTEIIANMNHEIRTPLSFIKGSAALLKVICEDQNSDEELTETLDMLNSGVARLTKTLELFTDLSNLKSGNYKPNISELDVKNIIDSYYLFYNKEITNLQKPIEIYFFCNLDSAIIEGDEQIIDKTIFSILDNAFKFTDSGVVAISLNEIPNNQFQLLIKDTGIGISSNFIDKIFEPFTQEDMSATRKYEGIGLSLALAFEYSFSNKFKISIDSEKNAGTSVELIFNKFIN